MLALDSDLKNTVAVLEYNNSSYLVPFEGSPKVHVAAPTDPPSRERGATDATDATLTDVTRANATHTAHVRAREADPAIALSN